MHVGMVFWYLSFLPSACLSRTKSTFFIEIPNEQKFQPVIGRWLVKQACSFIWIEIIVGHDIKLFGFGFRLGGVGGINYTISW